MGLGAKLADAATSGLTGAVTGGIGSIISGGRVTKNTILSCYNGNLFNS